MTFNIIALLVGLGLCVSGCVSVRSQAPDTSAVLALSGADSPIVKVDAMKLDHKANVWVLSGRVMRRSPALDQDTANSHLLVVLFNKQGHAVRELQADFAPRVIPRGHRMPGYATFQLDLDSLTSETTRVEIRAYEGNAELPRGVVSP